MIRAWARSDRASSRAAAPKNFPQDAEFALTRHRASWLNCNHESNERGATHPVRHRLCSPLITHDFASASRSVQRTDNQDASHGGAI
jgi:hypothetical protein